ncbi:uncharacterized protein LOC120894698 isoform X2 [Anopheles arabiensis]|uniref:uncharacterized protein LOC120894698 isoform X2 n=1 Tax=Anopheles arabiensis TaxID=7173 RepID=UPI001AACDC22|nr:uncharacterized protein LOC120894698 isoform X2 [Anopheles arabiensis]
MPRLLPEQVIETCRARALPTAIPGVPDPLPENCIAECALNETGILFNGQFRVEQAVKALSTQVPNDTLTWQHVIEVASKKCYMITVLCSVPTGRHVLSARCGEKFNITPMYSVLLPVSSVYLLDRVQGMVLQ